MLVDFAKVRILSTLVTGLNEGKKTTWHRVDEGVKRIHMNVILGFGDGLLKDFNVLKLSRILVRFPCENPPKILDGVLVEASGRPR